MDSSDTADRNVAATASPYPRPALPAVVTQHVEDAVVLRNVRSVLVRAPHVELNRLARLDERLSAHLDGAVIAGDDGYRLAQAALEAPGAAQIFVTAALALDRGDEAQVHKLLALAEALPTEAPRALGSAFGWSSANHLRELTATLLSSKDPMKRWLGVAACAAHGVDPGATLADAIADPHPLLRTTAIRTVARLGRTDLLPAVQEQLRSDDSASGAQAAWAAVLLGDHGDAARVLRSQALAAGVAGSMPALQALQLHLLSAEAEVARSTVRELVSRGTALRTSIRAAAWAGDVQVVPWLLKHMADDAHSRLAGESFSFLTGADLARLDLERTEAGLTSSGPNDDPGDDNVALDEDESLPWPDVERVKAWWERHRGSMPAVGRCFMGATASADHCQLVLRTGAQRQRHAAALLLSLLNPGTALFNVAAPAWRQQRALGLPVRAI